MKIIRGIFRERFIKTVFYLTGVTGLSIFLITAYHILVVPEQFEDVLKRINQELLVKNNQADFEVTLEKGTYLLKIKHVFQKNQSRRILINRREIPLGVYCYSHKKGVIETSYIILPKEIIRQGINLVSIVFSGSSPPDIDFRITNYRKAVSSNMIILFKDSALQQNRINYSYHTSLYLLLSFSITIMFYLSSFLMLYCFCAISFEKALSRSLFSFLPLSGFLSVLLLSSKVSGYRFVINGDFFRKFSISTYLIMQAIFIGNHLMGKIVNKAHRYLSNNQSKFFKNEAIEVTKMQSKSLHREREALGHMSLDLSHLDIGNKFILLFMFFLILSVPVYSLRLTSVAEIIADFSLIVLTIGTGIKFISFIKNKQQR